MCSAISRGASCCTYGAIASFAFFNPPPHLPSHAEESMLNEERQNEEEKEDQNEESEEDSESSIDSENEEE